MATSDARVSTGIPGLDEILHGGLPSRRGYLVRGGPGTGKTTLGLHFLLAGAAAGDSALMITLESSEAQIRADALDQGLDLDGVHILDLSPTREFFAENRSYDIFSPGEVERDPTTRQIMEMVERTAPARVFVDAITTFRFFVKDEFQFRKQSLSFLRYLVEEGRTVMLSSEPTLSVSDNDLRFMVDGVIELGSQAERGTLLRSITVEKLRGSGFEGGCHAMRLTESGMAVYPRLIPAFHERDFEPEPMPSGIAELDEMLAGGIERGTITIISGPTGVGKTTLAIQFLKEAAGRGERSVVYAFEEQSETIVHRSSSIGMPLDAMLADGLLTIQPVEPLLYSAGQFAVEVRRQVEQEGVRVVMVDSISGYRLTVTGDELITHLHSLGRYLKNMGVTVIFINETESVTGEFQATEIGVSYLADNLIFLRYLEVRGELRKAVGVLKKRVSTFGNQLRELHLAADGIRVGHPLQNLRGILTGTPEWVGDPPDGNDVGRRG